MNLRVFYLTRWGLSDGYFLFNKMGAFGWLLFMCGRKRFKFEVEKIVTGREKCNGSRNLY